MDKCITSLIETLGTLRTGRANPAMLDRIVVDYYGAPTPLQSLAGITCPDAQTVMVQPFDAGAMKEIEKAIIESDTGFTPNNDGKVLRINVPALTAERRKEMAKMCGKMGEEGKIALRNVRRDCMALVKEKEAGEDETRAMEAVVEKAAADYGKKVDKLVKDKEKEITSL
jgi:ribosome recycling factor